MSRLLFAAIFMLITLAAPARAQDGEELSDLLSEVGKAYAEPYLQPLANALGADMNSGLFHTASIGGGMLPLVDVYVGVKLMAGFVPTSSRTMSLAYETNKVFEIEGEEYVVPVTFQITDAPTVFGETKRGQATAHVFEILEGPGGNDVVLDTTIAFEVLPGLINTPVAPFAVPHIGIGSFMGTDLTLRYLPRLGFQDYGSVGLFGIGVRHSISQYLPLSPVNLTAQVMWQKLSIQDAQKDEVFAASAMAANVVASKSLAVLTMYGGLQVERSSIDISYTFGAEADQLSGQEIHFGMKGNNVVRAVVGGALNMGPVLFNVDAGIGSSRIISTGLGVSL